MSESIYKFVEEQQPQCPKKKAYRSKYDPNGPLIGSTFGMHGTNAINGKGFHDLKKNHVVSASFGLKSEAPNPKDFLRKGSREMKIPLVEHHNRNKESQKPSVPSRDDRPVQGLKTFTNFVTCNALEVINSSPKKRKGDEVGFHDEYGKVPAYLLSVKATIEQEKQLVERHVSEQYGTSKADETQVMEESERTHLINKLKQRWDEVNSVYQKYCHKVMLDTPGEIKRKASQEAELKQLEEDIEMLSRPGPLVIMK
ncbi:hypothetical protein HJC23_010903 [Cyclotella cryptica]|uniref:Enkurin domain-containing protein n=1 Tax=Cyclotella cryptica TaxID=29204 RepID=A0ABD3QAI3_9STRA|eukprot:CCRYP_007530-RB/>CCRYP_007530-RB protein AED:0.02 eAED:0.02 QI:5187/1/1/1/0.33/0.25/4/31/254